MTALVVDLEVGSRFWLEGRVWSVEDLSAGGVILAAGKTVPRVSIAHLAQEARPMDDPQGIGTAESIAFTMSALPATTRDTVEKRARHVRELLAPAESSRDLSITHRPPCG